MTDTSPLVREIEQAADPVAADADLTTVIGEADFAGTVTAASYTPKANVTGNDAESRAISIVNKGADGNGTTVVATLDLATGVNLTDFNETALTLSATPANLVVAAGDILAFTSVHEGSTGLADPGGLVRVEVTRS
jgi:hypothetical protein